MAKKIIDTPEALEFTLNQVREAQKKFATLGLDLPFVHTQAIGDIATISGKEVQQYEYWAHKNAALQWAYAFHFVANNVLRNEFPYCRDLCDWRLHY